MDKAVEELKKNRLVIYPTETVYGLGASALSSKAVKKVFEIKERSRDKPISVAVSNWDMLEDIVDINHVERNVMKKTLPGPITYIVKKKKIPSLDILAAGKNKIGIRYPEDWIARDLISEFGKPITSTSANKTNSIPPSRFAEIDLDVECKLFGGKPLYDSSSTVYDLVENKLIRRGPIPVSKIRKAIWN